MNWFQTMTWPQAIVFMTLVWLFLVYTGKAPEVKTVKYFLSSLNDRGGHLAILLALVIFFFNTAIRMFYYALQMRVDGKLDVQDAILLMALSFASGGAFGGASSVFYKTMEAPNSRPDATRSKETPTTTTTTATTTVAPVPDSGSTAAPVPAPPAQPVKTGG